MNIGSMDCQRFGFSCVDAEQYSDLIVDWDEDLTDGYDPTDEDNED